MRAGPKGTIDLPPLTFAGWPHDRAKRLDPPRRTRVCAVPGLPCDRFGSAACGRRQAVDDVQLGRVT